jgi:predicted HicB family RNase H-like nuclease
MPKITKEHDARIQLELPSKLKAELTAAARAEGISANELIRRGIQYQVLTGVLRKVWPDKNVA